MQPLKCPRCGGTESAPTADLVYKRECDMCFYVGEEHEFEPDLEPTFSWHKIAHGGNAWQVVEVKHWPTRIEVTNARVVLAEDEADQLIDALRTAAPEMGRKLAYPDPDYK